MLRKLGAAISIIAVATILAQMIGIGYLLATGGLTRDKLAQMMAVQHGIDLFHKQPDGNGQELTPMASIDDVIETRAVKLRRLEMRETALQQRKTLLDTQLRAFVAEREDYLAARKNFEKQLQDWQAGERAKAVESAVLLIGGAEAGPSQGTNPANAEQQGNGLGRNLVQSVAYQQAQQDRWRIQDTRGE